MKETIEYNTMKKFSFLFLSVFLLAFTGCDQEEPPVPPTLEVSASPDSIPYLGSSVISWKSDHSDYVLVNSQKMGTEDSLVVEGLTSSTTYTITAVGSNNKSVVKDVKITVGKAHAPTVEISSPSGPIPYGTSTSFSWVAGSLVTSVVLDGLFVADSSSFTTPVLYESKEYTLVVEGPGGTLVKKVMINVLPQNKYTISTTCGQNGSVLPGYNVIVTEGEDVTLTFKPEDGFEVESLKVDGVVVPDSSISLTLTSVTSDKNVEVTFKKDSILWPLLHIVWKLNNIEIDGNISAGPDRVVNYYRDGTYTILDSFGSRTNNWVLDRSVSPAGISYGGPSKLEKINNEQMIITYVNGYNQVVKYCFVNNGYK